MPWNGSTIGYPKKNNTEKNRISFLSQITVSKVCLILIISIILIIALILVHAYCNKPASLTSPTAPKIHSKDSQKKTKPVVKNNPKSEKSKNGKKKYSEMSDEEKLRYYKDKYGNNIPNNLKPIVYYLENPPKRNFKPNNRLESIFHNKSEREIAAFLLAEPGRVMIRPVNFGVAFDKDFNESLLKEIEFSPEDTAEQKELKAAVIETKKELLSLMKDGKKPSEIMTEAANELYQLGQYRSQLEKEVLSVRNDPNKSSQDLIETVMAANLMLKKKGLKPIRQPNLFIRKAILNKKR